MNDLNDKDINKKGVCVKILPTLMIVFAALFIAAITVFYIDQRIELKEDVSLQLHSSQRILKDDLEKDTDLLMALIEPIINNKGLETALINKDRKALKQIGLPIFNRIVLKYHITHFTLIDPERINIIRYHDMDFSGEKVNRYTCIQAEKIGRTFSGLELGALGTFTLRVVTPWYLNNKLIGYIELGMDICHIVEKIKDTLKTEPYVLIDKKFLEQNSWKEGMKMLGFKSDWDTLANYVFNNASSSSVPQSIIRLFSTNNFIKQNIYLNESSKGSETSSKVIRHNIGFFPLLDVSGKDVGIMVIADDYTQRFRDGLRSIFLLGAINLIIIILIFKGFYKILSKIDRNLEYQNTILENTVKERTADLKKANITLESNYLLQNTLRKIMVIAVEDLSMDDLLDLILAELVKLPFLSEGKGAIFLVEDNNDMIIMKRHIGLAIEIQELCKYVKFGHCLCGKSAKTRSVVFSDCIDTEHDTLFEGIKGHGHFIIPILVEKNLLGILNFYLKEGVKRDIYEEQFLISVANTIAGIIDRRKTADQLKIRSQELEQTNKELQSFTYIVSHDLRAPLVNLKGFSSELMISFDEIVSILKGFSINGHISNDDKDKLKYAIDEDIPESIKFIDSSVTKIDRMIGALLKLSRIGKSELNKEYLDINQILKSTLNLFAHQIETLNVKVTVGQLHMVNADRLSMEQIIGNLIDNAIKYRSPERPLTLNIYSQRIERETIFYFEDNGIGIDENETEKIFKIFHRLESQNIEGEGLGLANVKALIEKHGGKIWCKSAKGIGSAFIFSICDI